MKTLVIDRSCAQPSMALMDGTKVLVEKVWDGEPARAPAWMPDVLETLAEVACPVNAIDCFLSGMGPGSFSGVRACLAAMQGMALPGGKPTRGIASAMAIAYAVAQETGRERVSVIGDARRGRVWIADYCMNAVSGVLMRADHSAATQSAADFQLIPVDQLSAVAIARDGAQIVSPDYARIHTLLENAFARADIVPHAISPRASALGMLAATSGICCVAEPLPIYLQPAVAEESVK